jgi:hypothetical protein
MIYNEYASFLPFLSTTYVCMHTVVSQSKHVRGDPHKNGKPSPLQTFPVHLRNRDTRLTVTSTQSSISYKVSSKSHQSLIRGRGSVVDIDIKKLTY